MMKIAVMQPYIFSYIGYFQLINTVDRFIIYDDVNFINKGWINRNYILCNGKKLLFTIPLIDSSQNRLIKDIRMVKEEKWKIKLLKTISNEYRTAPFFDIIFPIIQDLMNIINDEEYISTFSYRITSKICAYLGIKTELIISSEKYNNAQLKGEERIMNICKQENAGTYINPIGGQELYDKAKFMENKIELYFLKTRPFVYKQFNSEFTPSLSIIDVLMFNEPSFIKQLLNEYDLV